jgi:hypothetical protein
MRLEARKDLRESSSKKAGGRMGKGPFLIGRLPTLKKVAPVSRRSPYGPLRVGPTGPDSAARERRSNTSASLESGCVSRITTLDLESAPTPMTIQFGMPSSPTFWSAYELSVLMKLAAATRRSRQNVMP